MPRGLLDVVPAVALCSAEPFRPGEREEVVHERRVACADEGSADRSRVGGHQCLVRRMARDVDAVCHGVEEAVSDCVLGEDGRVDAPALQHASVSVSVSHGEHWQPGRMTTHVHDVRDLRNGRVVARVQGGHDECAERVLP